MNIVWDVVLPHVHKLVLLSLADNANDDGSCFPSIATIVRRTGLSERSVQRTITALADEGQLSVEERFGRSSKYKLHPRQRGTPTPVSVAPRQADTGASVAPNPRQGGTEGCQPGGGGCQPGTHNHHLTVKEPSEEEQHAEKSRALMSHRAKGKQSVERGTRVPEPFELTENMRAWAQTETPHVNLTAATAEFVDYWRGIPGAKGRKLDWVSTWRNRMRDVARTKRGNGSDNGAAHESKQLKAWRARKEALRNA